MDKRDDDKVQILCELLQDAVVKSGATGTDIVKALTIAMLWMAIEEVTPDNLKTALANYIHLFEDVIRLVDEAGDTSTH